jgi:hypothetical protein
MAEGWTGSKPLTEKRVTEALQPQSTLLTLDDGYYWSTVVA